MEERSYANFSAFIMIFLESHTFKLAGVVLTMFIVA